MRDGGRLATGAMMLPIALLLALMGLEIVPIPPTLLAALSPAAHQVYARALPGWPTEASYRDVNFNAQPATPTRTDHSANRRAGARRREGAVCARRGQGVRAGQTRRGETRPATRQPQMASAELRAFGVASGDVEGARLRVDFPAGRTISVRRRRRSARRGTFLPHGVWSGPRDGVHGGVSGADELGVVERQDPVVLRAAGLGRTASVLRAACDRAVRQPRPLRQLSRDDSAVGAGRRVAAHRPGAARLGERGTDGFDGDGVRGAMRDSAESFARRMDFDRDQRGRAGRDVFLPAREPARRFRALCRHPHAALGRTGGGRNVCLRADADRSAGTQPDRRAPGGNRLVRAQPLGARDAVSAYARDDPRFPALRGWHGRMG